MQTFRIKDLEKWDRIDTAEVLVFHVPRTGRPIKLAFNTSAYVDVWASHYEDMSNAVLVASCHGLFYVEFSATKRVYLQAVGDGAPDIFVRGTAHSHTVPASGAKSFTTPMPTGRRNSEIDKLMHLARVNERRRDRQNKLTIDAAIARLEAKAAEKAPVIDEGDAKPKPKPKSEEPSDDKTKAKSKPPASKVAPADDGEGNED